MYSSIEHLALTAFTITNSLDKLVYMLEFMPRLRRLSSVWDELPSLRTPKVGENGQRVVDIQPRWKLTTVPVPETDDGMEADRAMMWPTADLFEWHSDLISRLMTTEGMPEWSVTDMADDVTFEMLPVVATVTAG